jgi:hypothetical protein
MLHHGKIGAAKAVNWGIFVAGLLSWAVSYSLGAMRRAFAYHRSLIGSA